MRYQPGSIDLANEINGTSGSPAGQPSVRLTIDDLPYFQDYLQNVLRPKVERSIESLDRLLTEAAWRHIVASVASEQHGAPEGAASAIRPLLEQKLGLRISVKLDSQFGASVPTSASVDLGEGVSRTPGQEGVDVMTVRRRPINNPIANAVASNPRPLGR